MKRIGAIVSLVALIVIMTASVCFGAQSLQVTESYPTDGQTNTTKENMCVQLWFNAEMGDSDSAKANADKFTITGPEGKNIPVRVFYDPEDSKHALVLADTTKINVTTDIEDDAEYTLTISGDLQDNKGNTLGEDETITFTTMNQGQSTRIYMLMMFVMFGGMFFFSSRQAKKQMAKQQEGKEKAEPFNPYKEAKRTGKSVEEVMAAHEKEMRKKEAKAARKKRAIETGDETYNEDEDNGTFKVKGPKPIAAAGGKFITGRKAEAEARKAKEEKIAKQNAAKKKKKK